MNCPPYALIFARINEVVVKDVKLFLSKSSIGVNIKDLHDFCISRLL